VAENAAGRRTGVDGLGEAAEVDPKQIEGIVRVYLEGEARPFIDQQEGWRRDTMKYECRMDLGAGVIDWRGRYKNPGA
jgi:hypothetical protein